MDPQHGERVVFVRDRTRDAAWLRAQAVLRRDEPPVDSAGGQPEDDIYSGTGADRWK